MREAALVPLPAIAGSEEAAPGDSGLLAREVVASAVGVAVARLGAVRLAAGLVVAVLGVGAAAVGGPLVVRARRGGEVLEARSLDQPLAPHEGAFEGGRAAENPSNELPDLLVVVPEDALDDGGDAADGEVAADEGPQAPVRERAGVCASCLAAEQERGDGRGDGAEDSESLIELALFVGLCAVGAERASGEVAQPRQVEAAARGVGEQLVEVRGGRGEAGAPWEQSLDGVLDLVSEPPARLVDVRGDRYRARAMPLGVDVAVREDRAQDVGPGIRRGEVGGEGLALGRGGAGGPGDGFASDGERGLGANGSPELAGLERWEAPRAARRLLIAVAVGGGESARALSASGVASSVTCRVGGRRGALARPALRVELSAMAMSVTPSRSLGRSKLRSAS